MAADDDHPTEQESAPPKGFTTRVKQAGLLALISVLTLNIWTGGPLAALWVGSRVQGSSTQPTMGPILVVIATLAGISVALLWGLNSVRRVYERVTGRRRTVRQHTPWLRSLRGERPPEMGGKTEVTALDVVVVGSVMLAVVVFEVWFFFLSGSSIDQRSGR
jgi:hypothetical protein